MKKIKVTASVMLAVVLLAAGIGIGAARQTFISELPVSGTAKSAASAAITFYVPETIYLTPNLNSATVFKYYVDCNSSGTLDKSKAKITGDVYFYCGNATAVSLSCSGASVTIGTASGTSTINTAVTGGNLNSGIYQGETATITWTATYTVNGEAKTTKAYTICYAPLIEPVATSIRTYNDDGGYLSAEFVADLQGWAYISGIQGYGSGGNYKANSSGSYILAPLLSTVTASSTDVPCVNWFTSFSGGGTHYTSHAQGDDYFTSVQTSPAGTLTVDTSRYSDLNQIPNLTCGFALTFLKNMDRINWYVSDFNANNAGWHYSDAAYTSNAEQNTIFRDTEYPVIFAGSNTLIPVLSTGIKLADSNVWSQSILGTGTQLMRMKAAAWAQNADPVTDEWNCIIMLVNTNITKISKETLRSNVRYYTNLGLQASDHPADAADYADFEAELKTAAERLGNPANTETSDLLSAKYAKLNRFSLLYDANGGTGAPGGQIKEYNINMFLSSAVPQKPFNIVFNENGGDLLAVGNKTVQSTFNNWNTSLDGNGSSFASGAVFSLEGDRTLYAQWANPKAGILPVPVRAGYTFAGWFTEASGGMEVTSETDITGNVAIYAQWLFNYQVLYDANGGAGAPEAQIKPENRPLILRPTIPTVPKAYEITYNANGGDALLPGTKTVNCAFINWNANYDGRGTSYSCGAEYNVNEAATLYAQWSNPTAGQLPVPSRSGYTFKGLFTQAEGGTLVTSDTVVSEDMEIFAHWVTRSITSLVFASGATKTEYFVGDVLDSTGLTLKASYDNNEEEIASNGYSCMPSALKKAGMQRIAVTYEEMMVFFDAHVTAVSLTGIGIKTAPNKTVYNKGEDFNTSGLTLSASYNNGSTKTISAGFTASYDFSSAGEKTVTISYTENGSTVNASVVVTVAENNVIYSDLSQATAGNTINIPVKIAGNEGFMGLSIHADYDASVFTPVAVTNGAVLVNGSINDSIGTAQTGGFKVVWTGSENATADGELFIMTFTVNANAVGNKTIALSYDQADTFNQNWDDVVLNCHDISVEISNPNYVAPLVVSSGAITATAGTNVNVPVCVTNNSGISKFKISLSYDTGVFTFVSVTNGSALETGSVSGSAANGILTVIWTGTLTDGEIFKVNFAIADYKQGTYAFGLSYDAANTIFDDSGTVMTCENIEVSVNNPYAGVPAWVQADALTTSSGNIINVPVKIYNNQGIMGLGINVNYDASILTPLSVSRETVTSSGMFDTTMSAVSNGNFKVIWNDTADVSRNGTVFIVSFAVAEDALPGVYIIGLSYSQDDTFNENWDDVMLDCRSSNITVNSTEPIITALQNTVIDRENNLIYGLEDGITSLDSYVLVKAGYELTCIPTQNGFGTGTIVHVKLAGEIIESYKIVVFGDVDGDGNIDAEDLNKIVNIVNYASPSWDPIDNSVYIKAGDIFRDGVIDENDISVMAGVQNKTMILYQSTGFAVNV